MRREKRRGVVVAVGVCLALSAGVGAGQTPGHPAEVIAQAIEAMGGEARLTGLRSLTLDSVGHGLALEQSERPEGPWLTTYVQQKELRDYEHQRRWTQSERRNWSSPDWSQPTVTVVTSEVTLLKAGTRVIPAPPRDPQTRTDAMALEPERLLFTARSAADLRVMPSEMQQRISQQVLAFTWRGERLRLLLNPWTHLPTMLEIVSNDPSGIWGDVTERRWYSFWTLEKGGLMYPRQTSVDWNGFPHTDTTVQILTVDGPIDDSRFAVSDEDRMAYDKAAQALASRPAGAALLSLDDTRAIDVAANVVQLPGGFNVELVRQPDGIVVIEGTSSSAYSAQVMAAVGKRFPGVPIKALVTTSDAWPHLGGVREYVARGIPIYPLDLNVSILTRLLQAPRTFAPDALARQPKPPIFRPVTDKTTIGSGDTRIELIPVRGETGERMMLAWLPGSHTLYSSDLIQRDRTGKSFFMPEMLWEVAAAMRREHIDGIDRVFGMHLAPTPWAEVTQAIAAAQAGTGGPR